MKWFLISLLALFLYPMVGHTQVFPPELICINGDTLIWELPINNCGNFNNYVIYGSQENAAGPYAVIANVADANQTNYVHPTPSNQTWFYYMETDADCTGQPVLTSDTLDNLIPEPGPLQFVTVDNDTTVSMSWNASPSPEVIGYIISRNNLSGTTILDTVYDATNYTDVGAAPGDQSETYFIVALDACGNVSLVPPPHNTMYLQAGATDPCARTLNISWNAYREWEQGIAAQEVWVSTNGSDFVLDATLEGSATSYAFTGAVDGATYCFYIQAQENGTDFFSNSNTICEVLDIITPVSELIITNASINLADVTIDWQWSNDAELTATNLLHTTDGTNFTSIASLGITPPLQTQNSVDITGLPLDDSPQHFQIETVDDCGDIVVSNPVTTVFLSGEVLSSEDGNQLSWTPYHNDRAVVNSYQIVRTTSSAQTTVAVLDPAETKFTDLIDLADPDLVSACYQIIAQLQVTLLNGELQNLTSRSNTVCLEQSAQVFVPNAFAPDGINRIFKPVMQFGAPNEYSMLIYDRYGGVVFESQAFDQGWDGKRNGRPLPQGYYLYLIRLTQSNGTEIEKKGGVMLIR